MSVQFLLLFLMGVFVANASFGQTHRKLDGTENNPFHAEWGAAGTKYMRITSNGYSDGLARPAGLSRANPRVISNTLFDQPVFVGNSMNLSDFVWVFGQFIDHDITMLNSSSAETIDIVVPTNDPYFDPAGTGTQVISMTRSVFEASTGTGFGNPRQQVNDITAWIDGSAVYGSDTSRANWLRTGQGGRLKTSLGNLLPYNTTTGNFDDPVDPTAPEMAMAAPNASKYFVAGDHRANEQPALTAMHTLFMREHNRIADSLQFIHPSWNDQEIYQRSRKIVGAIIQAIAYEEWLPAMGIELAPYTTYNDSLMPNLMTVFTAAAYRMGHTLINGQLIRLENDGDTISFGSVDLKSAYFNPSVVKDEGGIEPFLKGLAVQQQQEFDTRVIHAVRNFLFGAPGSGGLDLVAMNINRGREVGLSDYNTIRSDLGMNTCTGFTDITSDTVLQMKLQTLYSNIDNIDPWVGMLAEDHVPQSLVGESVYAILKRQFEELRDGDRYYYEYDPAFTPSEIAAIKNTRLSDIIRRNTNITTIQDDVFFAKPHQPLATTVEIIPFDNIQEISLKAYPNPFQSSFKLNVRSLDAGLAQFVLIDINGREIKREQIQLTQGKNSFEFNIDEGLSQGVYQIILTAVNGTGQVKIIKN